MPTLDIADKILHQNKIFELMKNNLLTDQWKKRR